MSLYLSIAPSTEHESVLDVLEELDNPSQVVLEVVCKHFRENVHSHLLSRGLKIALGAYKSDDIDVINERFVGMSTREKYLSVCLALTELLRPMEEIDSEVLMKKLAMAQECVNKAVQVCQEWDYPEKWQIDTVYDQVR